MEPLPTSRRCRNQLEEQENQEKERNKQQKTPEKSEGRLSFPGEGRREGEEVGESNEGKSRGNQSTCPSHEKDLSSSRTTLMGNHQPQQQQTEETHLGEEEEMKKILRPALYPA